MSAERWQHLRQIFDAVLESDERERDQLLDDLCAGDEGLRAEILGLLTAVATADPFLDAPATRFLGTLQPGMVLAGRFELIAPLGHGGMGEVWRARDRQLAEDVAIKTISADRLGDAPSLERFKREILLARKVAHPNVCRMYDLFEDDTVSPPRAFLTMECIEGETLSERLKRQGPIAGDKALAIFEQIAAGVAAAH
jgi:eukaryotic-like serine/threonine-protein kinase